LATSAVQRRKLGRRDDRRVGDQRAAMPVRCDREIGRAVLAEQMQRRDVRAVRNCQRASGVSPFAA
jgi:hypothetical protein